MTTVSEVQAELTRAQGSELTRAFYHPLYFPQAEKEPTKTLIERGLLEIREAPLNEGGTPVPQGFITEAGKHAVEEGVLHNPFDVPFTKWPLVTQLDYLDRLFAEGEQESSEYNLPSIEEALQSMTVVFPNKQQEPFNAEVLGCGGYSPTAHSATTLYRALWLFKPCEVDFSDMYKCPLFTVATRDRRFVISFEFFKYELGMYFYAYRAAVGGSLHAFQCGVPGADNGTSCTDPEGKRFFEAVTKAIEKTHHVYYGNNFEV